MSSRSPRRRSRSPYRGGSPRRSPRPPRRSRSRSRSRRNSRSPARRRSRSRGEYGVEPKETIKVTDDDSAFVLGRGGKTKMKIARVSGARLELRERNNTIEIYGNDEEVRKAKKYVELVMAQRVGPVYVDFEDPDSDLTTVDVPVDCVGYVTGKAGQTMRKVEEEWGTLMFFAAIKGRRKGEGDSEKLAIFGDRRGRRGAELKVMSAVEQKHPGHFTRGLDDKVEDGEWATDIVPIRGEDFSYALGKGGATRKKLARASGCIMEYVGEYAFLSGYKDERQRARQYLAWLMQQRTGAVHVETEHRDDVLELDVPTDCVGYVTGHKGAMLRTIELRTGTFCFVDGGEGRPREKGDRANFGSGGATERLLIFGCSADDRKHAKRLIDDLVDEKRDGRGGFLPPPSRRSPGYRRRSRSRSRSRRRYSRSPRRSRSRSRRRSRSRERSRSRRRSRS